MAQFDLSSMAGCSSVIRFWQHIYMKLNNSYSLHAAVGSTDDLIVAYGRHIGEGVEPELCKVQLGCNSLAAAYRNIITSTLYEQ